MPCVRVNVPVEEVIVKPLIDVADAAPNAGVTNVGEVQDIPPAHIPLPFKVVEALREHEDEEHSVGAAVQLSELPDASTPNV